MDTRKITITSTVDQTTYTINSSAETLAELKADMDAANINYNNLLFFEGLTRTELLDDRSLLPKDVMFRGNPTNELVIMLVLPKNKISLGCDTAQSLLYEIIIGLNLQDLTKECFNKVYTECTLIELLKIVKSEVLGDPYPERHDPNCPYSKKDIEDFKEGLC